MVAVAVVATVPLLAVAVGEGYDGDHRGILGWLFVEHISQQRRIGEVGSLVLRALPVPIYIGGLYVGRLVLGALPVPIQPTNKRAVSWLWWAGTREERGGLARHSTINEMGPPHRLDV